VCTEQTPPEPILGDAGQGPGDRCRVVWKTFHFFMDFMIVVEHFSHFYSLNLI
jgi:hypothetical protein